MANLTKTEKYVALTYAKYFGRTADNGIIDKYVSIGKASKILQQIIKDADIEQYKVHGDDLQAEVHNEFQNLFSRKADNKELQKYVKVLQKGKNLPINSIVKKATKFDKDVYNNKQEIAKFVAENGGGVFDLSKVTKANPIDVKSLTSLADLQAKIDALPENDFVPTAFDGKSYNLTDGVDNLPGTDKNDVYNATASTLTSFDSIDGGKGTDTLAVVDGSGAMNTAIASGLNITSVEKMTVKTTGSLGDIASGGTLAQKQINTYDFTGSATAGTIVVNYGSVTSTITSDGTPAGSVAAFIAAINAAAGQVIATVGVAPNTVDVTAPVAGTALPSITFGAVTGPAEIPTIAFTQANVAAIAASSTNVVYDVSGITSLEDVSVSAAQNVNLKAGTKANVDVSGATGAVIVNGGKNVAVTNAGTTTTIGATTAATGTVTVTDTAQAGSAIAVDGGTDVTITASGNTGGTIAVGQTALLPTGNVKVSSTGSYTNGAATTMGAITINGGSTVTVTQSAGITDAQKTAALTATTNNTVTQGAVNVDGGAATTSVTVVQDATVPVSNVVGATDNKIGVAAGAVTIDDKNAGSALANTITTVSVTNAGTVNVDSAALATLNLAGTMLAVNTASAGSTGSATLALNTTDAKTGIITLDTDTKTVNVTNSGTSTLTNLIASSATALTVAGSGDLSLTTSALLANVTSVNVTNTGSTTFGATVLNNDATFTAAGGSETVTVGTTTKAISMGAGNDKVILDSTTNIAFTGTIDGGAGDADRLTFEDAKHVVAATADNVFEGKISGFEELELAGNGGGAEITASQTIDLGNLDDISKVIVSYDTTNAFNLDNMANNGTLRVEASQSNNDITVIVKNAIVPTTDVMNIELANSISLADVAVTVANVETIRVKTEDTDTTVLGNVAHELELVASSATNVVVSGNAGVDFTVGTANSQFSTDLTSFDASAVTAGAVTYTSGALIKASTVKGGAGNDVINMAAALAAVTLSGNAGNDTLIGGQVADTINGGEGNDIIQGGAGADILTGGAGADIFKYTATATDSNGVNTDTITDFVSGTDKLEITVAGAITYAGEVSGYGTALTTLSNTTYTAVLDTSNNTLYVDLNGDGALTVADLAIKLNVNDLSQTDFVSLVGGVSTINGTAGDDIITDTAKADTIQGFAGKDTFVFNSDSGSLTIIDIIRDFTTADDSIKTGVAGTATNFATGNGQTIAVATTAANTAFDGTVKYYFASAVTNASTIAGGTDNTDGVVFIDWDMDGTADQAILIVGGIAGKVDATDFIA